MDAFFSLIHENWTIVDHPTTLAAFALWNLNWIHPFIEGNGRTARAALLSDLHETGQDSGWKEDCSRAHS